MDIPVRYIDTQRDFDEALEQLNAAEWIGFDTEFVGEKTFIPVLCLLQVIWENGILLIDTLRVNDLSLFLDIVADPNVLKITHAGDNDYRLLNTLFGIVPVNLFDTQIAAGFVGYNYPAGFGKIVERELGISLSKSHTVADWEARPLDNKALSYAIEDVKYLPALHKKLMAKLDRKKRGEWPREEISKWEAPGFYANDPYKEALNSDFIYQLDQREQIFLLRIYAWRRQRAFEFNVPKEQVVQGKHISAIMRTLKDGSGSIRSNRTIPENTWKKYQAEWQQLWRARPEPFELELLNNLPGPPSDDPELEWHFELLYHFVKRQCLKHEISAALLFPRGDFNKLKNGHSDFDPAMLDGWRATILGIDLVNWLKSDTALQLTWQPNGGLLVSRSAD